MKLYLVLFFSFLSISESAIAQNKQDNFWMVQRILIEGNHKTKESLIRRELDIGVGDTIFLIQKDSILKRNRNKIFNLKLFIKVELRLDTWENNQRFADLVISLNEQWYFFPVPIFELSDRNFNEWWNQYNADLTRTNYGVRFTHNNFTGYRDKLDFLIQFGFTQKFNLHYSIPYIDKKQKHGITLVNTYAQNRSIAYSTEGNQLQFVSSDKNLRERFHSSILYTYRNAFYVFHNLEVRYQQINIADTITKLNPNYFRNGEKKQEYFQVAYSFQKDLRDIQVYPLEGSYFDVRIEKIGLGIYNDVDMLKLSSTYAIYRKLNRTLFFESKITGLLNWQTVQPYSQASAVGYGDNFLRGYELYVIDGQHFFIQKNTLKQELFNTEKVFNFIPIRQFKTVPIAMYLTAYFDTGFVNNYVFENIDNELNNRMLYGGGIGLDMVTFYNLVLKFNYSINTLGETGFFININTSF